MNYTKAFGSTLNYSLGQSEFQQKHLLELFSNGRLQSHLKQNLAVDVVIEDGVISLHSFLGNVFIEKGYGLDGEYICPLIFFYDLDDDEEKRDLLAVRLGVESGAWADSDGETYKADFSTNTVSIDAPALIVRKVYAKKLAMSDARFMGVGK